MAKKGEGCEEWMGVSFKMLISSFFFLSKVKSITVFSGTSLLRKLNLVHKYCRFGNVRENLIFANIREFVASQIQSSRQ